MIMLSVDLTWEFDAASSAAHDGAAYAKCLLCQDPVMYWTSHTEYGVKLCVVRCQVPIFHVVVPKLYSTSSRAGAPLSVRVCSQLLC